MRDESTPRRRVYSQGILMTDISFAGAMLGEEINHITSLLLYRISTSCNYPLDTKKTQPHGWVLTLKKVPDVLLLLLFTLLAFLVLFLTFRLCLIYFPGDRNGKDEK